MSFDYDVAVYLGSLPKIKNHNLKVQIMRAFAEGAAKVGARTVVQESRELVNARLAVILGWVGMNFSGPHIYFRQDIINHQHTIGGRVMPIDGSCFKFSSQGDLWLRYSLDSVFYNQGFYANAGANGSKWGAVSKSLGLTLEPWRTKGNHVLICLQRDSGWNAKGFDQTIWLEKTLKIIRSQSSRPIVIRPHPANKVDWNPLLRKYANISISNSVQRSLHDDVRNAHCGVFYNSSSSVASVLAGVPVFVSDESAVTYAVANLNTRDIENPAMPDRTQWLNELAACHWTMEHSLTGDIYNHFLPHLPS